MPSTRARRPSSDARDARKHPEAPADVPRTLPFLFFAGSCSNRVASVFSTRVPSPSRAPTDRIAPRVALYSVALFARADRIHKNPCVIARSALNTTRHRRRSRTRASTDARAIDAIRAIGDRAFARATHADAMEQPLAALARAQDELRNALAVGLGELRSAHDGVAVAASNEGKKNQSAARAESRRDRARAGGAGEAGDEADAVRDGAARDEGGAGGGQGRGEGGARFDRARGRANAKDDDDARGSNDRDDGTGEERRASERMG